MLGSHINQGLLGPALFPFHDCFKRGLQRPSNDLEIMLFLCLIRSALKCSMFVAITPREFPYPWGCFVECSSMSLITPPTRKLQEHFEGKWPRDSLMKMVSLPGRVAWPGKLRLSSWTPPWASKMGAGSLTIRHQSSRIGETLGPIAQNTTCFWNIWSLFSLEITDAQTIAGTLSESWKADPWVAIPAIQCWPSPLQDICVNRSMWRRPRPKPRRRRT